MTTVFTILKYYCKQYFCNYHQIITSLLLIVTTVVIIVYNHH